MRGAYTAYRPVQINGISLPSSSSVYCPTYHYGTFRVLGCFGVSTLHQTLRWTTGSLTWVCATFFNVALRPRKRGGLSGTGRKGGQGRWRWGKRDTIHLSLHCYHQNDSCIKMGSDESHFNVSLIVRDKVRRLSTNHNLSEGLSTNHNLSEGDYIPIATLSPPELFLH